MSVVRVVARITPLNVTPNGLCGLLSPGELGNPSNIEIHCVTDPRNGLQYMIETALIIKTLDLSENIDEEISVECEKIPGLVCATEKNHVLSPFGNSDDVKDYAAIGVPKSIGREKVPQLLNSANIGSVEPIKKPSLKIRFNLKKIRENQLARKKARDNLLKPLLKYFIEDECLICGFVALKVNRQNRTRHMSTHINATAYKCDCCDVSFPSTQALYNHRISSKVTTQYSCTSCDIMFPRKHLLTVHQMKDHTESMPQVTQSNDDLLVLKQKIPPCFSCCACSTRLTSWNSIVSHKKLHPGKVNYQCLFCGKLFINYCLLRYHSHIRVVTQQLACKFCGKKFASYRILHLHQKSHMKECYTCEACGDKKFYFQKTFLKHMRLIHGTN